MDYRRGSRLERIPNVPHLGNELFGRPAPADNGDASGAFIGCGFAGQLV